MLKIDPRYTRERDRKERREESARGGEKKERNSD